MKKSEPNSNVYQIDNERENNLISLLGPVTISNSSDFRDITGKIDVSKNIILDFKDLKDYDSFLVLILNKLEKIATENKIEINYDNISEDITGFIDILKSTKKIEIEPKILPGKISRFFIFVGSEVREMAGDAYDFISFLGELLLKLFNLIIRPWDMRWKDMPLHFTKTGVYAIPITVLIMFLIGIITGYQGAMQLKQFGADIFIADLIGISLTRELTPLMVAILVSGRSGSSFAAEIGTMKVSEEIDALESMGFDSMKFLVLPRVLSVTIAMPILTMICNVVGIGGGLLTALTTLEITITGFINQLQSTLSFFDVFTGVFKSIIFGFMIAAVGCFRGLQVKGGAESVGRYTTASVVTGVLLIILVDAMFVFVFQALGI